MGRRTELTRQNALQYPDLLKVVHDWLHELVYGTKVTYTARNAGTGDRVGRTFTLVRRFRLKYLLPDADLIDSLMWGTLASELLQKHLRLAPNSIPVQIVQHFVDRFYHHWFDAELFVKNFTKAFSHRGWPPFNKRHHNAETGLKELLGFINKDEDIKDLRWAAYMLATTYHEAGRTWHPIKEGDPTGYAYNNDVIVTRTANGQKRQFNKGKYYGRGYVQLTGWENYVNMDERLGLGERLIDNPDLAMESKIAYRIMSIGMREGLFRRRKTPNSLEKFIPVGGPADYYNARDIINGFVEKDGKWVLDWGNEIANYAKVFEAVLRSCL